jgi:hypothetical protein
MALILDAIAEGSGEREASVRAAQATADRDSILGRYSLDADGHTTTTAYGQLAVVDGWSALEDVAQRLAAHAGQREEAAPERARLVGVAAV